MPVKTLGALLLPVVLGISLAAGETTTTSQKVVAFTNATVIDATGSEAQPGRTVLIRGDRIIALGPTEKIDLPKEAEIIDATGKFLIPGLWDMHMHLSYTTDLAFPLLIANGVTGIRDMGGDLEQIDAWRKQIESGERLGPHILRAGPVLDGPRPEEGKFRLTIKTPDEGREAVRSLKKRGVDFIKVYHFLSRDSYLAIVDEAKKQSLSVAGHIPNGIDPAEASDAGHASAEHVTVMLQALITSTDKRGKTPKQLTAEAFDALMGEKGAAIYQRFVKNGTWHTPTLVVQKSFLMRNELATKEDARRDYIAASTKEDWEKNNPVLKDLTAETIAERKAAFPKFVVIVGQMQRAGVRMLAGTDPPTRDVFPGFTLHDELGLLVEAGLTPMQALQAATRNAAQCLGLLDSLGTIEVGKIADLVLLEANPLANISNTQKIGAVVLRGKLLPKASLTAMLEAAKAEAGRK